MSDNILNPMEMIREMIDKYTDGVEELTVKAERIKAEIKQLEIRLRELIKRYSELCGLISKAKSEANEYHEKAKVFEQMAEQKQIEKEKHGTKRDEAATAAVGFFVTGVVCAPLRPLKTRRAQLHFS